LSVRAKIWRGILEKIVLGLDEKNSIKNGLKPPKNGKTTPFRVIKTASYSQKLILARNGGRFWIQHQKMV
jgi:hypothetical protein